jgi:hypothetical protein
MFISYNNSYSFKDIPNNLIFTNQSSSNITFTLNLIHSTSTECCYEILATANGYNFNYIRISSINPIMISANNASGWSLNSSIANQFNFNRNSGNVSTSEVIGSICFKKQYLPQQVQVYSSNDNGNIFKNEGRVNIKICDCTPFNMIFENHNSNESYCCYSIKITTTISGINYVRIASINPIMNSAVANTNWSVNTNDASSEYIFRTNNIFSNYYYFGDICFTKSQLPQGIVCYISSDGGINTTSCYSHFEVPGCSN